MFFKLEIYNPEQMDANCEKCKTRKIYTTGIFGYLNNFDHFGLFILGIIVIIGLIFIDYSFKFKC